MKRRDFIRTGALAGLVGTLKFSGANKLIAQPKSSDLSYDLVTVMGGEPDVMFEKAIASMGGMGKFVKPGYRVVVKPNIGWDRAPELAANTNPLLVKTIIKHCLNAGAKEVLVFDHTCDEWRACYQNSGIEKAVNEAGGKMVHAHEERYYKEVAVPKGVKLKNAKIHEAILNCDAWINVPILKHHGGAKLTISMKNFMGIVWDRRFWHSNDLQQCIADCSTVAKPVLNIVDAYRIMKSNGPKGKSEADVVTLKALVMSTDIVAADTAALRYFNQAETMEMAAVSHIQKAEALGVGTTNLDKLRINRIRV